MKYKRVFGFGCSYTSFFWPTWIDIIGRDLDVPYQNWGICGAGNVAMTHRMVECDIKNNFTEDDLIISTWSTWHREDRYHCQAWTMNGNIFNDENYYDKKFRKKYWDSDNDIIKNVGSIYLANKSFNINYQANITESRGLTYSGKVMKFYQPYVPTDVFPWTSKDWAFEGALSHVDNHPDIAAHLNYVENYIYPAIGCTLKDKTRDYYMGLQNFIVNLGKKGHTKEKIKQWGDLDEYFLEVLGTSRARIGM